MKPVKNFAFMFAIWVFLNLHLVLGNILQLPEPGSHNLLAADLFHAIVENKSAKNILFSPIPIETALTMTFTGAEGKTAEDLRKVLRLGSDDKTHIIKNFRKFLSSLIQFNYETKTSAPKLLMANRIFVNDKLQVPPKFNKIVKKNFYSRAENVNFSYRKLTIDKINNWVRQQTRYKIKKILNEDDIDGLTNLVLANGIYFKGKWKYSFDKKCTKTTDFHLNKKERTAVEMMHIRGNFRYANLPEFEATVLELPYKYSNLNILFVLPNQIEGLGKLEEKLRSIEFNFIPSRLAEKDVCACIPKFQVEHELDLKPALQKIGLTTLFSDKAELPGLFKSAPKSQSISIFKQKAIFEIDELGSEAAAASGSVEECGREAKIFNADHPFIFAVRSDTAVYFAGHVVKI